MKRARSEECDHGRIEGVPLSERYVFARNDGVYLDETDGHVYRDKRNPKRDGNIMSVSAFRAQFFPKFERDKVARMVVGRGKYKDFGSPEDVKAYWDKLRDEAASKGTKMHANFEDYVNGLPYDEKPPEFRGFMKFISDHPELVPIATEKTLSDDFLNLAGTADVMYGGKGENSVLLGDYKRSKGIEYRGYKGKKCTHPATKHLQACNFEEYRISMCLYKFMLEKTYRKEVEEMFLIVFKPDTEQYSIVYLYWNQDEMNEIIAERLRQVLLV